MGRKKNRGKKQAAATEPNPTQSSASGKSKRLLGKKKCSEEKQLESVVSVEDEQFAGKENQKHDPDLVGQKKKFPDDKVEVNKERWPNPEENAETGDWVKQTRKKKNKKSAVQSVIRLDCSNFVKTPNKTQSTSDIPASLKSMYCNNFPTTSVVSSHFYSEPSDVSDHFQLDPQLDDFTAVLDKAKSQKDAQLSPVSKMSEDNSKDHANNSSIKLVPNCYSDNVNNGPKSQQNDISTIEDFTSELRRLLQYSTVVRCTDPSLHSLLMRTANSTIDKLEELGGLWKLARDNKHGIVATKASDGEDAFCLQQTSSLEYPLSKIQKPTHSQVANCHEIRYPQPNRQILMGVKPENMEFDELKEGTIQNVFPRYGYIEANGLDTNVFFVPSHILDDLGWSSCVNLTDIFQKGDRVRFKATRQQERSGCRWLATKVEKLSTKTTPEPFRRISKFDTEWKRGEEVPVPKLQKPSTRPSLMHNVVQLPVFCKKPINGPAAGNIQQTAQKSTNAAKKVQEGKLGMSQVVSNDCPIASNDKGGSGSKGGTSEKEARNQKGGGGDSSACGTFYQLFPTANIPYLSACSLGEELLLDRLPDASV